jgi:hypothetical protein
MSERRRTAGERRSEGVRRGTGGTAKGWRCGCSAGVAVPDGEREALRRVRGAGGSAKGAGDAEGVAWTYSGSGTDVRTDAGYVSARHVPLLNHPPEEEDEANRPRPEPESLHHRKDDYRGREVEHHHEEGKPELPQVEHEVGDPKDQGDRGQVDRCPKGERLHVQPIPLGFSVKPSLQMMRAADGVGQRSHIDMRSRSVQPSQLWAPQATLGPCHPARTRTTPVVLCLTVGPVLTSELAEEGPPSGTPRPGSTRSAAANGQRQQTPSASRRGRADPSVARARPRRRAPPRPAP